MKTLKYLIKTVPLEIKDWWDYVEIEDVLLTTIVALCCAVLLYVIIAGASKPTIELKKEDWTCTQTVDTQTTILVGKALLPQTRTVCVQYTRSY